MFGPVNSGLKKYTPGFISCSRMAFIGQGSVAKMLFLAN